MVQGDVLEFSADVLALKYAQHFYGADEAVSSRLIASGADPAALQPQPWEYVFFDSKGQIPSRHVLWVGVPRLLQFDYNEIERFAFEAIKTTRVECPQAQHIAMTLHGPGYGLDEVEALQSELRGMWKAILAGLCPATLRRVSILEHSAARIERLQKPLNDADAHYRLLPADRLPQGAQVEAVAPPAPARTRDATAYAPPSRSPAPQVAPAPGAPLPVPPSPVFDLPHKPPSKPRIFVAMPFATEMEDVYYYGIQNPVRQLGFICERIDQEAFTGDVLPQMKTRIEAAEIVIADLTGSNPNVYLEVGYAWGKARPTVLLVKEADQLKFDVRGQKCLTYKSIKDLETQLTKELRELTGGSAPDTAKL